MDWAANYFDEDIKIGDKITLPIGERKFIDTGKKRINGMRKYLGRNLKRSTLKNIQ